MQLMSPADPEYASFCKWFIGAPVDVHPTTVARCTDARDVAEALRFARANHAPFALRSGGHSYANYSSTDGVLIDLGPMDSVEVDEASVRIGPGVRVGRLAVELARHGRVLPLGWCTTVGLGGSALGGGFGPLGRFYGLTSDHLEAAQVVLADGQVRWVDTDREPDLFWALRGAGGGNFAAVTSMVLRTQPAVPLSSFACWWDLDDAVRVIDAWQRWAPDAPDEVNAELVLRGSTDPSVPPEVVLFGIVVGARQGVVRALIDDVAELSGSEPYQVRINEMSATEAAGRRQFAGDEVRADLTFGGRPPTRRPGLRLVKSEYFERPLPVTAITTMVDRFTRSRELTELRMLEFVPWGAAMSRVPASATAFVHRSPRFLLLHDVQAWGPAESRTTGREWIEESWATAHQWGTGHAYPNVPDPDLTDWAHAYYGANLPRLQRVKAAYDPTCTFRFAQSIPPAA